MYHLSPIGSMIILYVVAKMDIRAIAQIIVRPP